MKPTREEQIALLDQIRERVLSAPADFDMSAWHSECGTTHCLAGWAEVLMAPVGFVPSSSYENNSARDIGKQVLPAFVEYFYGGTARTREWLEHRAYAQPQGQVVRTAQGWMDAGRNTYPAGLSQEEASAQAASNTGCIDGENCNM